MMRGRVVIVCVLAAACGGGSKAPAQHTPLAPLRHAAALAPCPASVGDVIDLTLPCLGGGPDVHLKGPGTGVPTLVNVYGSWCAPCQDEMPVLVAFAKRAGSKVALLGVDTEDEDSKALLFAFDFKQHYPAVVDADGVFLRKYSSGPPVTLFIDPAGRVVFRHPGPFKNVAELAAAVRKRLGVVV